MEWRPIETFDGGSEYVLLYGPGDPGVTIGYLWRCEKWQDSLDGREFEPTHWQPLPPPPNGE